MNITINITPEIETQVRNAAARDGVTPDAYIINILQQHIHRISRVPIHLDETETTLLEQINLGLPEKTWQRYRTLIKKRQAETLQPAEQEALIQISDEIERLNVRRISALVKLAQVRHISLDTLMDALGIKSPSYA